MTTVLTTSATKMAIPIHSIRSLTLPVPGGTGPVLPAPAIRGRSSTSVSSICAPFASIPRPISRDGQYGLSLAHSLSQFGDLADIWFPARDVTLVHCIHDHCSDLRLGRYPDAGQLEII